VNRRDRFDNRLGRFSNRRRRLVNRLDRFVNRPDRFNNRPGCLVNRLGRFDKRGRRFVNRDGRFAHRDGRFDRRPNRFNNRGAQVRQPRNAGSRTEERRFVNRGAQVREPRAQVREPGMFGSRTGFSPARAWRLRTPDLAARPGNSDTSSARGHSRSRRTPPSSGRTGRHRSTDRSQSRGGPSDE